MKKSFFSTKFFLIFLIFFNSLLYAQNVKLDYLTKEEINFLKLHGTIKIQAQEDWSPFSFIENGKPKGYSNDFFSLLAKKLNLELEYISGYTWDEYLNLLKEKKIDIITNMVKTTKREKFALFTEESIHNAQTFIYSNKKNIRFKNLKSLEGFTVAITKGFWYEDRLRKLYPKIKLYLTKNSIEAINAVSEGKVDALIEIEPVVKYYINKNSIKNIYFHSLADFKNINKFYDHIAIRKDWEIFKSILDKTIKRLTINEINQLRDKWFFSTNTQSKNSYSSNFDIENFDNSKIKLTKKELLFIKNNPFIKVSNENNWAPFDFSLNGVEQGYFIDILKIIEKRTGLKFKYINGFSWEELFDLYEKKQIDLIHPLEKIFAQEYPSLISNPVFLYSPVYVTKKDFKTINSIKDLFGKRVAVGKDFGIELFLKEKYPQIKLIPVINVEEGIKAVLKNEADALIDSKEVIKYIAKKQLLSEIKIQKDFKEYNRDDYRSLHFMTHFEKEELISILNKGLESITPGEYSKLEEKWFGSTKSKQKKKLSLNMEQMIYLNSKKQIKACLIPDFMPFEGIDKRGKHIGITKDLLKLMEERLGIEIEIYQTNTFEQSIKALKNGTCDMMPILFNLSSREKEISFTKAYLEVGSTGIATKTKSVYINNIQDLKGKKLAAVKESAYYKFVKTNYPNINIIGVSSIEEAFKKIRDDEIFGYISGIANLNYYIQYEGIFDIKIAGKFDSKPKLSLAVNKNEPILKDIFNKIVSSFSIEDIESSYNKWINIKIEKKVDYSLLYKTLSISFFILIFIAFWLRKLKNEINKRKEIEKELIIAKQEALDASAAKSDFLANMSHEIRTPLNGIIGMTTLAMKKIQMQDYEKAQDFIKKAQNSSKTLQGIISDILDFSKIEARKLELEYSPLNLREVISQINDLFSYTAFQKNLKFLIEQDNITPEYILGDKLRLIQILTNLIGNAIKFTDKGFVKLKIELISKNNDDIELKFSIIDSGKGIARENQDKLFEAFSQEDNSISREYGGTGLGLIISKNLVELMNGKISFRSTENKGSIFYFTLKTKLLKGVLLKNTSQKEISSHKNNKLLQARILLVEDNEINQELAYNFLSEIVSEIEIVKNGKEAIELLKKKDKDYFNLILMDIHMPVLDGNKTTLILKEDDKYKDLPIIAMSANVLKKDMEYSLKCGMCDYITKPFEVNDLFEKVKYWINKNGKVNKITKNKSHEEELRLNDKKAISNMLDRKDLYENLIESFLNNSIKDIKKIESLLMEDKKEALSVIHTLKGISGTLGAQILEKQLQELYLEINENKTIDKKRLNELNEERDMLIKALKKWLKRNREDSISS